MRAFHYSNGGNNYESQTSIKRRTNEAHNGMSYKWFADYQWCEQNSINKSSFYNWVNRLRKVGYQFPEPENKKHNLPMKQEIVKVEVLSNELKESSIIEKQNARTLKPVVTESDNAPAVEIRMSGTTVKFFNNTNPELLKFTLECLRGTAHAW